MGLFIRTRLETRRPPPPPSSSLLPPNRPEICSRVVGRNVCLSWWWGQVVRERWRGGVIAPPGPRRRKLQLEQLAREPLACLWFFLLFFFFFPFSLPSPLCSAGPCRLGNPHPSCPPPTTAAPRGLGAPGSPWAVYWGGKLARSTAMRETEFLAGAGSGVPGGD